MAKLLYIESSPRKERSASIEVSTAFLDSYRSSHPHDEIDVWDLWLEPLMEFDQDALDAKYAVIHQTEQSAGQKDAWAEVAALADRFKNADKLVISQPMWNYGLPYKLKHLIDVIAQPGLLFSFSPETGYRGLVNDKRALMIYARGDQYPSAIPGNGEDLQKPYMDMWLRFVGVTDIQSILIEGTLHGPDVLKTAIAEGVIEARKIAQAF